MNLEKGLIRKFPGGSRLVTKRKYTRYCPKCERKMKTIGYRHGKTFRYCKECDRYRFIDRNDGQGEYYIFDPSWYVSAPFNLKEFESHFFN